MHYLDVHESVRRQLQVGADGVVSAISGERQSALELARCLISSFNLFKMLPAARILSASKPLPERLLLSYSLQHASERKGLARADAWFMGFLGLFPGWLAFLLISDLKSEPFIPAAVVGIGIVVALAVWGYERNLAQMGEVWEYSEWIDFTSRTWNSRRHYNDGALPDVIRRFPLDSLALFCYEHGFEAATTYGVAIGLLKDIAAAGENTPDRLIEFHEAESEAAGILVGNELATLWGIDCFSLAPT